MAYRIQYRRATAAVAAVNNVVLADGEPGLETDTGKTKLGDGVTAWNVLPYDTNPAAVTAAVAAEAVLARAAGNLTSGTVDDARLPAASQAAAIAAKTTPAAASADAAGQIAAERVTERALQMATYVPRWKAATVYAIGDKITTPSGELAVAKTAHESAATFTGNLDWTIGHQTGDPIPVIKPAGDTRPGVWEYTHNSNSGYVWHILAGAGFASPAALMAFGIDNGNGTGILLANKAAGIGLTIDQKATITAAAAYGIKATQSSTLAPLVRLEQNVSGAANALQCLAFNAPDTTPPTATQILAYFGDPAGFAGGVYAADGRLEWRRPVHIRAKDGATDSFLDVTENSAFTYAGPGGYHMRITKNGPEWWSDSGGSTWWPHKMRANGSHMYIESGAATATLGGSPVRTTLIDFQNAKIGFFGTAAVARPAAVPVTAEGVHAALVTLGLITA